MRRRTYLATAGTALLATAGCTDLNLGGSDDPTTDDPTTDDPTTDDPTTDDPTTDDPTTSETTATDPTTGTTTAGTTTPPTSRLTNPSFESGLDGWTIGRHLPDDPNKTTGTVDSSVETTGEHASDGEHALSISIDGSQDDGTVWVQQEADLSDVATLAVDALVSSSFNQIANVAVYAGPVPDDPLTERDFDTSNSFEGHDDEGWRTFEYDVSHDGAGLVAVGISVVWETGVTRLLDDVTLAMSPANTTADD